MTDTITHPAKGFGTADGSAAGSGPRRGGLDAWSPRVMPPIGVDLSPEQELACALRFLASTGFSENMAGHITWQQPERETLLVNPWGLWWDEVRGSDICEVDLSANVVAGRWDVTPAIHIHTELHRRRPDARVVIHNHPYWVTVVAAVGWLPEILHQNGSMFLGDLKLVHEYTGEIDSAAAGAELAEMIGDASVVILASHGVIVTGATMAEAAYRAGTFDRFCRLAVDVARLGRDPLTISERFMAGMRSSQLERASAPYWDGAVRSVLRNDPGVLA